MPIDGNAMSLAQYAVQSNDPMVQAITFSLIDCGTAMTDIPLVNKKSLVSNVVRWEGNLPTVNWGSINTEPAVTIGTPKPYQEQAYILRNAIDVDKYLVEDQNNIADPRATQLAAYLKATAFDFNDTFINNDHVTGNANKPVGLKSRIANGAQYGVWNQALIDAGGTDISLATMTQATANKFVEQVTQLLWTADSPDGDNIVIYANEVLIRRFATALRLMGTSGGFDITQDQFGRSITKFRNAVVKDIGYKLDQQTRIIPGNGLSGASAIGELATGANGTGASATFTSMYAVNYGMDHFFGWQFEDIAAHDLGLLNNGVIYRTVIDWAVGLMNANIRSMARLFDIKIA